VDARSLDAVSDTGPAERRDRRREHRGRTRLPSTPPIGDGGSILDRGAEPADASSVFGYQIAADPK
jgi:hypothetical protein